MNKTKMALLLALISSCMFLGIYGVFYLMGYAIDRYELSQEQFGIGFIIVCAFIGVCFVSYIIISERQAAKQREVDYQDKIQQQMKSNLQKGLPEGFGCDPGHTTTRWP